MTITTVPLTDTFDQWRIKTNELIAVQNAQISSTARASLTTTATDIVPAINEVKALADSNASGLDDKVDINGDTMTGDLIFDTAVNLRLSSTSAVKNSSLADIINNDGVGDAQVGLTAHKNGTIDTVLAFDDVDGSPYYADASGLGAGGSAMQEIILEDGTDYTAGSGGPDTFALPADPVTAANLFVSFDGLDQFEDYTFSAAPDITFPNGIPAGVEKVRVKVGSTVVSDVADYVDLDDTPNSYTGSAYKAVRVSGAANGLVHGGTGAVLLDSGTTGQRPASPVNGMIRYNTDTNKFEGYENGAWVNLI